MKYLKKRLVILSHYVATISAILCEAFPCLSIAKIAHCESVNRTMSVGYTVLYLKSSKIVFRVWMIVSICNRLHMVLKVLWALIMCIDKLISISSIEGKSKSRSVSIGIQYTFRVAGYGFVCMYSFRVGYY